MEKGKKLYLINANQLNLDKNNQVSITNLSRRSIWHAFSKALTINPEESLYEIILAGIPPTVTLL